VIKGTGLSILAENLGTGLKQTADAIAIQLREAGLVAATLTDVGIESREEATDVFVAMKVSASSAENDSNPELLLRVLLARDAHQL